PAAGDVQVAEWRVARDECKTGQGPVRGGPRGPGAFRTQQGACFFSSLVTRHSPLVTSSGGSHESGLLGRPGQRPPRDPARPAEPAPDPKILTPRAAVARVPRTAICGSALHLYDGFIPTMEKGDILGHEFMGEVVDVGPAVTNLRRGDRVVVPFTIACGNCFFCRKQLWSCCDNSNPNAWVVEKLYGYSGSGLFGYSHMMGGYAGRQAQAARVPFRDVGPLKIPDDIPDEKVLFLSDIFPTAYMAAENCDIQPGDTVAVWGCGPVGLLAIKCCYLLGAERVIAIDRFGYRLRVAAEKAG